MLFMLPGVELECISIQSIPLYVNEINSPIACRKSVYTGVYMIWRQPVYSGNELKFVTIFKHPENGSFFTKEQAIYRQDGVNA
jgi:hypothetical protein